MVEVGDHLAVNITPYLSSLGFRATDTYTLTERRLFSGCCILGKDPISVIRTSDRKLMPKVMEKFFRRV